MQRFIDATRTAVAAENWYAALALALTMPDICGRLEHPHAKSRDRFVRWYDAYLLHRYQRPIGHQKTMHTFLGASDCYALRCAYLHQGEFGIEDRRAQVLARFRFTTPPRMGGIRHMNQRAGVLQLQVDQFCRDVCDGVGDWLGAVGTDEEVKVRMAGLASIEG